MSKTKLIAVGTLVFGITISVFKLEVIEARLDEAGYTYIGSALTGVLRVNAENGDTAPCIIAEGNKLFCLSWKD